MSKLVKMDSKIDHCSRQIESLKNGSNHYELQQQSSSSSYCHDDRQISNRMDDLPITNSDNCTINSNDDDLQMNVDRKFHCPKCPFEFATQNILNRHLRTHVPGRKFICSICGNRFQNKSNLNKHYRIHSNEKPFKCSHCNYSAKRKTDLDRHVVIHSIIKCQYCDYQTEQKLDLNKHQILEHSFLIKTIKEFSTTTDTISHNVSMNCIQMDNDETTKLPSYNYKCDICSKCFSTKSAFDRHKITHTDERPFDCPNCNLKFKRKDHLQSHMKRIHL